MNSPQDCSKKAQKRTNQEWVDALTGQRGAIEQQRSHEELARYLYRVAYNHLAKIGPSIPMLRNLAAEELADHAQDFVQDVLEKMAENHFARLHQFRGEGHFTSWAAQVMHNQITAEVRKQCWRQQELFADEESTVETRGEAACAPANTPETALIRTYIRDTLEECLARVPERYRIAFVRRIIENERADRVAAELKTTANAVNLMVFRVRRRLQEDLTALGLAPPA